MYANSFTGCLYCKALEIKVLGSLTIHQYADPDSQIRLLMAALLVEKLTVYKQMEKRRDGKRRFNSVDQLNSIKGLLACLGRSRCSVCNFVPSWLHYPLTLSCRQLQEVRQAPESSFKGVCDASHPSVVILSWIENVLRGWNYS